MFDLLQSYVDRMLAPQPPTLTEIMNQTLKRYCGYDKIEKRYSILDRLRDSAQA
jgi:hypothetical protein